MASRHAKIGWKALSQRIGHADVAFTMRQYVQADLEADWQVATTLAELIIGGMLASVPPPAEDGQDRVTAMILPNMGVRARQSSKRPRGH